VRVDCLVRRSDAIGLGIPTMRSQNGAHDGFQSKWRGWLHRAVPRKRHQMRHLCDLTCLLAKQMLSQLSYTPILVTILF
jgi:hypothetical protein